MNKFGECLKWIDISLSQEVITKLNTEKEGKLFFEIKQIRNKAKTLNAKEERDHRLKSKQVLRKKKFLYVQFLNYLGCTRINSKKTTYKSF